MPQVQRERTEYRLFIVFLRLQMASKHAKHNGDDGEGRFDRRYLFKPSTWAIHRFAQYTGIRGPNTTINLACASATAAFGVAEDWLDAGRVDRVVIISGDSVTAMTLGVDCGWSCSLRSRHQQRRRGTACHSTVVETA